MKKLWAWLGSQLTAHSALYMTQNTRKSCPFVQIFECTTSASTKLLLKFVNCFDGQ